MPIAGPVWTSEEDEMLRRLVAHHGTKKWAHLATIIKSKKSKQCRRRWKNFQDAELKKTGVWSPKEDALLLDGHRRYGNKWTEIAKMVGGRTDNAVKNRWASLTKKHPELLESSPSSVPSASAGSSFSGSEPSRSTLAQSSPQSLPARPVGQRPSRLRNNFNIKREERESDQPSSSNQARQQMQGSLESEPTMLTHSHMGLTVRTKTESDARASDQYGSGSAGTPGSVNIRVWKDALTPTEQQAAQEVNALDFPVTIQLEDDMIPITDIYGMVQQADNTQGMPGPGPGPGPGGEWPLENSGGTGDLAKWLHTGFTPRAGGSLENFQQQRFGSNNTNRANTPRTQSVINGNQRQLLHKLFSKGSFNYGSFSNAGQPAYYPPQQMAYNAEMQQQYVPAQPQSMQQSMYEPSANLAMSDIQSALKPANAQQQQPQQQQQPTYHINALAYDNAAFARQQSFGMNRPVQLGQLRRGFSFGGQPLEEGNAAGNTTDNAGLEVLVTPNFSSQELNMLLDALGDEEFEDANAEAGMQDVKSEYLGELNNEQTMM